MKQFMEDRQKVLTNLATAQYYLKAYDAALLAIEGVLQFDPRNVKALYRKGKASSFSEIDLDFFFFFVCFYLLF